MNETFFEDEEFRKACLRLLNDPEVATRTAAADGDAGSPLAERPVAPVEDFRTSVLRDQFERARREVDAARANAVAELHRRTTAQLEPNGAGQPAAGGGLGHEELRTTLAEAKGDADDAARRLAASQTAVGALRAKLEDERARHDERVARLRDEISSAAQAAAADADESRRLLARAEEAAKSATADLKRERDKAANAAKIAAAAAGRRLSEAKGEALSAIAEADRLRAEGEACERELQRLSAVTVRLRSESQDKDRAVAKSEDAAGALRDDLASSESVVAELRQEVAGRDTEIAGLRLEVTDLRHEIKALAETSARGRADALAAELDRANHRVHEMERQVEELREALVASEARHADEISGLLDQIARG